MALILLASFSFGSAQAAKPLVAGPAVVAPVLLDGESRAVAWIFPNSHKSEFYLEGQQIYEVLGSILPTDRLARIRALGDADKNTISAAALESEGVGIAFNENLVEVELIVPISLRLASSINLSPNPQYSGVWAPPSRFSGYVNSRVSQGYTYPQRLRSDHRDPLTGSLDSVINFNGVALESGADLEEKADPFLVRRDIRMVKDFKEKSTRLTVGDLQVPVVGYQNSRPEGGVSFIREFSMQPYRSNRPMSKSQISIQRASTVEIHINGVLYSRLQLQPGPFDLKDYPLISGMNSIDIKITDDLGKAETIHLEVVDDFELLAPGLSQFGYALSMPSRPIGSSRAYDPKRFTGTFYQRLGISEYLTSGVNLQGDTHQKVLGVDSGVATRFGFLAEDLAASTNRYSGGGYASRFRYRSIDRWKGRDLPGRLNLEVEYRSIDFAQLGSDYPKNIYAWSLDHYLIFGLPYKVDLGLGLKRQFNRDVGPNRDTLRMDLSKSWGPSFQTSLFLSTSNPGRSDGLDGRTENRALFLLSWTDPTGRYSANATHETSDHRSSVTVSRNNLDLYDDVRLSASAANGPDTSLGELQTEFLGHRGIVRLDHKTTRDKVAGSDNHFTRASLATSLAWADSKFALTRPINDSFAIISAAGRPEGVNIPINSTEGRAETEITSFGPGVLGNLGSYYHSPVSIDDSVLPMGYQPPNLFYNVQNGYKQGTRIHLAINEIISIQFELLDPMRKPVSLETGELKKVDDNAFSPITFFSSRSGSVLIEGLRPGNYILKFYSGKWLEIPLKIDSEIGHGLLRIPPIVLQPVQSDGAVSEK